MPGPPGGVVLTEDAMAGNDQLSIPKYSAWSGRARLLQQGWDPSFKSLLDKVSAEVKLYEQAFSPMAKRNVALSMHERIVQFEKAWKKAYGLVPTPKALQELDAAACEEVETDLSGHKYDHVSCIGYAVGTIKFDTTLFKLHWDGKQFFREKIVEYSGDAAKDKADYLAKCARMKDAIETAFLLYQTEHGSNSKYARTLKLFMAPEFFFRGFHGAYDISLVSEIFSDLRRFTANAKFKDWLFVFGTVICASFDDRMVCGSCGESDVRQFQRTGLNRYACPGCPADSVTERRFGATIDNVALIQKGGESDDKNAYVIAKEYVSHIDFRRVVTAEALKAGKKLVGLDNYAQLKEWKDDRQIHLMGQEVWALPVPGSRDLYGGGNSFKDERMGGSLFTIDGIKFGMEICLDHARIRLAPGSDIQVQLVPSAGQNLNQFACVRFGIAFNVDGAAGGSCDVRVNTAGDAPDKSTTPAVKSQAVKSGGQIMLYEPRPLPYS
jgi:hypothetical protein